MSTFWSVAESLASCALLLGPIFLLEHRAKKRERLTALYAEALAARKQPAPMPRLQA